MTAFIIRIHLDQISPSTKEFHDYQKNRTRSGSDTAADRSL